MRNTKTPNKTIKKRLNKCRTIFHAYNDTQFRYCENASFLRVTVLARSSL